MSVTSSASPASASGSAHRRRVSSSKSMSSAEPGAARAGPRSGPSRPWARRPPRSRRGCRPRRAAAGLARRLEPEQVGRPRPRPSTRARRSSTGRRRAAPGRRRGRRARARRTRPRAAPTARPRRTPPSPRRRPGRARRGCPPRRCVLLAAGDPDPVVVAPRERGVRRVRERERQAPGRRCSRCAPRSGSPGRARGRPRRRLVRSVSAKRGADLADEVVGGAGLDEGHGAHPRRRARRPRWRRFCARAASSTTRPRRTT